MVPERQKDGNTCRQCLAHASLEWRCDRRCDARTVPRNGTAATLCVRTLTRAHIPPKTQRVPYPATVAGHLTGDRGIVQRPQRRAAEQFQGGGAPKLTSSGDHGLRKGAQRQPSGSWKYPGSPGAGPGTRCRSGTFELGMAAGVPEREHSRATGTRRILSPAERPRVEWGSLGYCRALCAERSRRGRGSPPEERPRGTAAARRCRHRAMPPRMA